MPYPCGSASCRTKSWYSPFSAVSKSVLYGLARVALSPDERHVVAPVHPSGLEDADAPVFFDVADLVEDTIGEVVLGYRACAEPYLFASCGS